MGRNSQSLLPRISHFTSMRSLSTIRQRAFPTKHRNQKRPSAQPVNSAKDRPSNEGRKGGRRGGDEHEEGEERRKTGCMIRLSLVLQAPASQMIALYLNGGTAFAAPLKDNDENGLEIEMGGNGCHPLVAHRWDYA